MDKFTAKMTGLVVLPHWGHNMGPKRISQELHLPAIVQGGFESLESVLSGNKPLTNTWLSRNFGLDIGRAHKQPLLETELCDTGDKNQRSFWRDPHSVKQGNPRGHKSLTGKPGCRPASRKPAVPSLMACALILKSARKFKKSACMLLAASRKSQLKANLSSGGKATSRGKADSRLAVLFRLKQSGNPFYARLRFEQMGRKSSKPKRSHSNVGASGKEGSSMAPNLKEDCKRVCPGGNRCEAMDIMHSCFRPERKE